MYLNRGHGPAQLLKMLRVDFGPKTAYLIHRVTRCRGYRGACVGLPNPSFWQRNLSSLKWDQITHQVQESAGSTVGDKHPPGCNPRGDRATTTHL